MGLPWVRAASRSSCWAATGLLGRRRGRERGWQRRGQRAWWFLRAASYPGLAGRAKSREPRAESREMGAATHGSARDAAQEGGEHALHLVRETAQAFVGLRREIAEIASEQRVVLQFPRRAGGDVEEARFVLRGPPAAALRDVRRRRSGGPTHLAYEAEALTGREGTGSPVGLERRLVSALPDHQPAEVVHAAMVVARGWSDGAGNCWSWPSIASLPDSVTIGSRLSALGSRLSALGSRLSALGSRLSALCLPVPAAARFQHRVERPLACPRAAAPDPRAHGVRQRLRRRHRRGRRASDARPHRAGAGRRRAARSSW